MGSGSGGVDRETDLHAGETPVLLSAWSQLKLGWVETRSNLWWDTSLASAARINAPSSTAQVAIAHAGRQDPATGLVTCDAKEYFLMQYRTARGYDLGLNAVNDRATGDDFAGVVIYHVDERQSDNDTALLKLLDVEEASAVSLDQTLASHDMLWSEDSETVFDAASSPSSTFQLGGETGVTVTVGAPHVDADGEDAVHVTVRSLCDVTGLVPQVP